MVTSKSTPTHVTAHNSTVNKPAPQQPEDAATHLIHMTKVMAENTERMHKAALAPHKEFMANMDHLSCLYRSNMCHMFDVQLEMLKLQQHWQQLWLQSWSQLAATFKQPQAPSKDAPSKN